MVTKGIIKSIDYNGNTCKVRVPILESACDDAEIVLSAIFATAPGIFNGYKEEDVVIVSFEDNNYENAIILGKLYLGASKENEDPRGTVSCANLKSENQATIPLSSKLVYDAKDKNTANVKGSYNDYKTLADIVDGLQTQKTEIGSLNVKIIDDGENWGAEIQRLTKENTLQTSKINQNAESITAEVSRASDAEGVLKSQIKQTADEINAEVSKKIDSSDETKEQRGLGWNLNTESWKINAKDTVTNENGETEVKNINIVTIDRNGMSIAGDLKLNGYPKNIVVRYAKNMSDEHYPDLYNGKEINPEWLTAAPKRDDGYYIWQWTHTESFSFDGDKWTEQDDDKVVCITGAKGDAGKDGYTTVTVMLYKRSKTSLSDNPISDDLYYKFSDQKLYTDDICTTEYTLPTGWSYTISGTGNSSNGDLYCIAAVASSNTDYDSIPASEWVGPTLYVENGTDGKPGISIKEVKQWYILWPASAANKPSKPDNNKEPTEPATSSAVESWMSTPPEAVNGYVVWTCYGSIFSDDNPSGARHIEYSDPVKDNAYALAQGKTTNYYSDTDPSKAYSVKKGDCWFDTGYVKIDTPATKTGYLGKFIVSTTGNILVKADETDSNRYIPDAAGSTRLIKITPNNIDDGLFTVKTEDTAGTDAYETGNLKQWDGDKWEDIAGELVTNKLTANYINALDITAKKITVLDKSNNNKPLFEADGINGTGSVKIANFNVNQTGLYSGNHNSIESEEDGVYLGADGISIGSNFKVKAGSVIISDYTKSTIKKYRKIEYDNETEAAAKYTDWTNWDSDKWLSTIPGRDNGLYIWEWTKEEKGNGTFVDLGRVCITGAKGDPGTNGKTPYIKNGTWWVDDKDTGIKAQGAQGAPGNTPYIKNGNWWIGNDDTGIKAEGTDGASITAVKEYYLATSLSSGVTVNTTGWSEKIQNITADNKYLWNYEKILSNDTVINTTKPCIIGVYGDKGNPGRGISSITNYYLTSSNNSDITHASDGWDETPQPTSDTGKYLWNYEVVVYTDGTTTKTTPCIIGVHGEKGDPGATGRSVSSVTKFYKRATSKPDKPSNKEPTDWSTSPPSFVKGNNYYESDRTIYDSVDGAGNDYSWSDVIENSMLTVDFINSLGITAQGLKVVDGGNNTILSANIANETPNSVQIGGFTVDSDRLYAGTPGTDGSIELATSYNLVAYRSNNAKIDACYEVAVGKIIVNKDIANLTVYIRSDGETTNDYTVISIPNVENYPTADLSSGVKAHTSGKQNSGQELGDYIPVNYSDLKQGDWIYVVYRKDGSVDYGADTGYILIPETTDIKLEAVDGVEWGFIRDSAFDIKGAIKGASLKVGSNFSVYSTGAIKSTSGTIGKLAINDDGLSYGSIFKIDPTVSNWGSSEKQKATVVAGSTLVQNTLILPGQFKNDAELSSYYWPAFDSDGFKVLYTSSWTGTDKTYKLGEYSLWDLAGIPIVSSYSHFMTLSESLACFGEDRSGTVGWGAPIIYVDRHINIGKDWVRIDLSNNNIRKILTVVCTTYVQPTENTDSTSTTPASKPNQSGNLFVSYDDYSNGKFWIRSNNNENVTVSILAIGVAPIVKLVK